MKNDAVPSVAARQHPPRTPSASVARRIERQRLEQQQEYVRQAINEYSLGESNCYTIPAYVYLYSLEQI